jgi:hypothetical protein
MNEGNGAEVLNCYRLSRLGQKHHKSIVDIVQIPGVQMPEGVEGHHDVGSNNWPDRLQESTREAIGPWRLVRRKQSNDPPKSHPQ